MGSAGLGSAEGAAGGYAGRCRLASFCKVIGKTNLPNASGLEALT